MHKRSMYNTIDKVPTKTRGGKRPLQVSSGIQEINNQQPLQRLIKGLVICRRPIVQTTLRLCTRGQHDKRQTPSMPARQYETPYIFHP